MSFDMQLKYINRALVGLALVVAGTFGWHLMATAINQHADVAATLIIEDTLTSSAAYDLKQLRKLESHIVERDLKSASDLLVQLIDVKTWQLEACVSEQCEALKLKLSE